MASAAGSKTCNTLAIQNCSAQNPIIRKCVILGILTGRIEHPHKQTRSTFSNIFLDSGSDQSYITESCAQQLGLPVVSRKLVTVNVFGCHKETKAFPVTNIRLAGEDREALVEVFITKKIQTSIKTEEYHEPLVLILDKGQQLGKSLGHVYV